VATAILHAYMEFAAHRGFKYFHMHVPSPQVLAACPYAALIAVDPVDPERVKSVSQRGNG
jgi:hypothetical protein